MATEQTARFVLTADDRTGAAVRSATRNFDRLGKQAAQLRTAIGAIGAGLSLAALQRVASSAVSMGEQLGNVAEKAGVTAEQLQVLRLAAEQNGSSAEQLDSAMIRLAASIGQAGLEAQGLSDKAGPAGQALKQLGISVLDAGGNVRQAGDLFPEIIDRLSAIPDAATRAALAAQIFGRRVGPELAVMINSGSAAFERLRKYMADTGALISNDTVQAARELSDQMGRVGTAIRANFDRGFLEAFAGEFRNLDEAIADPQFVAAIHDIGVGLGSAMRAVVEQGPVVVRHMQDIAQAAAIIAGAKLGASLGKTFGAAGALIGGGIGAAAAIGGMALLDQQRAQMRQQEDLAKRLQETQQANAQAVKDSVGAIANARGAQVNNERSAIAQLRALHEAETAALEAELDKQQAALKAAVQAQRDARQQQQDVEREFAQLVRDTSGKGAPTRSSVVLQASAAQSALSRGDARGALDMARQAADSLRQLREAGDQSATLELTAKRLQQIANAAAQAQTAQADQAVEQAQRAVDQATALRDQVKAEMEALKALPIGFDADAALQQAQTLRSAIEQALAQPIVVPVEVAQTPAVPADVPSRAYGGRLPGRSPHPRADNILFWGTAGELVIGKPEADAIQRRYGSGAIAALLQGRLPDTLPRYAMGGVIDHPRPSAPSMAATQPRAGDTINLTLPGGGTYAVTADHDTAAALARDVRMAALKAGRR